MIVQKIIRVILMIQIHQVEMIKTTILQGIIPVITIQMIVQEITIIPMTTRILTLMIVQIIIRVILRITITIHKVR